MLKAKKAKESGAKDAYTHPLSLEYYVPDGWEIVTPMGLDTANLGAWFLVRRPKP